MKRAVPLLVCTLLGLALAACSGSRLVDDKGQVTAFVHVNVVPMMGEVVLQDHTVLVEGSGIVVVGPAADVAVPRGAVIIDGTGAYLMPGLADMHVHSTDEWVGSDDWPVPPLSLYLSNGVTTVRNCGHTGDISLPLRWRDQIEAGKLAGPTMYATGSVLHGDQRGPIYEGVVQEQLDRGYDFIKLRDVRSVDQFRLAADGVAQASAYMVSHVPFRVGFDQALSAGIDEIAHIEEFYFETLEIDTRGARVDEDWIVRIVEAMLRLYGTPPLAFEEEAVERLVQERHADGIASAVETVRSAGVMVGTTMVVNNPQVEFDAEEFLADPSNRYLSDTIVDMVRQGDTKIQRALEDMGPEYRYLASVKYAADRLALRTLKEAGVPLILGTDAGSYLALVPGFSVHDELRILTENGFTPYEAISTATVNAGRAIEDMTGQATAGTIEVGRRADLILTQGNPLDAVSNISEPLGVMAAGRWYSAETLQQMAQIGE